MTSHDTAATRSDKPARRWQPLVVGTWLVAAGLLIGAGYWLAPRGGATVDDGDADALRPSAEVTRATISDTRSFPGTLGHGTPLTVAATVTGVVTALAEQGTAVVAGTELFRVDERPVIALHGSIPMFRDLRLGDAGVDVAQLIANLSALGYADCDTTHEFTACVADAVADWQDAAGFPATGAVARGDVVFVPGDGRIGNLHTRVGGIVGPGSAVLDLTGSDQVVTLEVELRHRELLPVGTDVEVRLPGGATVLSRVSDARVVSTNSSGGMVGGGASIVAIEVTLVEPVDASFLGATVDVLVEVDTRSDVLTVPVSALLALTGGGHGVEVVSADGTTTVVPVDTGLFSRGVVEVSGEGIDEGTTVVVAAR